MLYPGLVSISFRQLTPAEIVAAVAQAGLASIEWGGDVHVPHGDVNRAKEVAQITQDAQLTVAAYGSYYRLATAEQSSFAAVLDTAVALGAPLVRVWAGDRGSAEADQRYRDQLIAEARRIAEQAAAADIIVATECHGGTLTDDSDSTVSIMEAVDHPNFKTFWQPPQWLDPPTQAATLEAIAAWTTNVHVFNWGPNAERFPLADAAGPWGEHLRRLDQIPGDHHCMLEFVIDDDLQNFFTDAATLKRWLAAPADVR